MLQLQNCSSRGGGMNERMMKAQEDAQPLVGENSINNSTGTSIDTGTIVDGTVTCQQLYVTC